MKKEPFVYIPRNIMYQGIWDLGPQCILLWVTLLFLMDSNGLVLKPDDDIFNAANIDNFSSSIKELLDKGYVSTVPGGYEVADAQTYISRKLPDPDSPGARRARECRARKAEKK